MVNVERTVMRTKIQQDFKDGVLDLLEKDVCVAYTVKTPTGKGYFLAADDVTVEACMDYIIDERFEISKEQFMTILLMSPDDMRHAIKLRKIEKLKFELAQLENNI